MYPGFAKTARDEGFDEIAEWLETLARAEKSHAGRFAQGLESISLSRRRSTARSGSAPASAVRWWRHVTTTYDPHHPQYLDEADLREELTRVFDLCHGCRLCFKFCTSFPTLFEFIDRHDDQDAARLTPAEQDQVVDECFQCKLCYVNCPYIPGQHEWAHRLPPADAAGRRPCATHERRCGDATS